MIGRIADADIRSGEYGSKFVAPDPDVVESGPDPVLGFLLLPADAPPDSIIGSSGADRLRGNPHDNILRGAGGADTIVGGAGHDRLYGGVGNDVLSAGAGNDIPNGGAGRDALDSRAGKDTIIGGAGNDTLIRGAGRDLLSGGARADVFMFRPSSDRAVILDFQDDIDAIRLVDLGISSFDKAQAHATQSGVHVAFDFENGDILPVRATITLLGDDMIFV